MGTINRPDQVKLICGLLAPSDSFLDRAMEELVRRYGPVDIASSRIPFSFTEYYTREMGPGLLRQWIAFDRLINPGELASIKIATNAMEDTFRHEHSRQVNIDPGYLTLANLILASTKDFSHRIYLAGGIYGEVTLIYKGKAFTVLPWTYPDYQSEAGIAFLLQARSRYQEQLRY